MVAMAGRPLQAGEAGRPLLERMLLVAQWGIRKLARFTLFVRIIVVFP